MKQIITALIMAAGLLISSVAHAELTGYLCEVTRNPQGGGGDFGYIHLTVYSGASCTGTFVGVAYFCTTGYTSNTSCSTASLFSDAGISALAGSLLQAQLWGRRVVISLWDGTQGASVTTK